jgi:dTDP-4-amino-4,6-dideoxygalactose transaminase
MIPFAPPFIDDDVIKEVTDSLRSGWITTGPKVRELENKVSEFTNAPKTLCVNSATSALIFVLKWFGVKEGDEVIVPSYTYCSTALSVLHLGATPVMVDCGDDFNIDVQKIKDAITEKTKVIIPVDIAGFPCDYNELFEIVNDSEIKSLYKPSTVEQKDLGRILVLADSAHSLGAKYNGKKTGSIADVTIFSFHAVKNLTTAEGGAICFNLPEPFNNEELYIELRPLTLNGQTKDAFTKTVGNSWRYDVERLGYKINMPDVCAAIGLAQFTKYNDILARRMKVFDIYTAKLSEYDWAVTPPYKTSNKISSCHVFLLRIKDISEDQRDHIIEEIYKQEVSVNVHFVPLPSLTLFKNMNYDIKDYPVSHDSFSREISLPIYPQLTNSQVDTIINSVVNAYNLVIKN